MERGRNIGRGNGSGSCASAVDDTAKDGVRQNINIDAENFGAEGTM